MPGLLKVVLPVVGGVMAVSKLMLLVQPTAFFETVGMGSIVAESETPLAKSLIVNLAVARLALGILGVASYFRGSETRARIGAAIAVVLVASIYADVAIPLEFELDKRGRATDVPVPLDLTSLKSSPKYSWSCRWSSPSRPTSPSRASSRRTSPRTSRHS